MPPIQLKSAEVETMRTVKIGVVLLALLLAGMIFVPSVSAAATNAGKVMNITSTPEQIVKINELWGKNITVGEYFEQVQPDLLVDMPADLKEKLYTMKWVWPDSSTRTLNAISPNMVNGWSVTCSGNTPSKVSTVISFSGSASCSGGTPYYMAFTTYLENSANQIVAQTGQTGFSITNVANSNMWQPNVQSGTFHTYTTAFIITPVNNQEIDALPRTSSSITWP